MKRSHLSSEGAHYFKLGKIMHPGEVAMVTDTHTLAFCFGDDDVACLKIDEAVDKETANELISRINQFLENAYKIQRARAVVGPCAKSS